jgi:formylmethanofuran dehydrogenase subunit A
VNPAYDTACEADIRDWFEANYTVQMSNYTIREEELGRHAQIPLKPHAS